MALLTDLLKIATFVFSFIGSYFWIRRNVWTSEHSIAQLVQTKWGYNKELTNELCGQKADSLIAWAYITLGAFAQLSLFFIPVERPFASPLRLDILHIAYMIGMAVIIQRVGKFISRKIEHTLIEKVNLINKPKDPR